MADTTHEPPTAMQSALREQLASVVENTTDYVGIATADGHLTYINETFKRIIPQRLRQNEDNPAGMSILDFHPSDVGAIITETAIPYATVHGTWQGETQLLDSRGNAFAVLQTIVAHTDWEGTLQFLSTICRDIEAIKKSQQSLREMSSSIAQLKDEVDRLKAHIESI